ncbi:MAG: NADPH:quinone oxidoreductase family protein [Leptolyngbyaceae cyanobacterium MO_188.B28]|nr:NADPH:quinone oxidoreductase family protein [Leptolyngbyaceae cyanobacterium MO_188.B28]
MRALLIHDYSGPTALRVDQAAVPEPGPGEVRIRVRAAGLNNSDLQSTYGTYRVGHQGLPHILGQEAAGEVDAVGPGVTSLAPGMRVVGHVNGAFAEQVIGPETELLKLPDPVSFEVAASLPIAYLTASLALVHKAKLQPDEWVLVHPGSGGVGSAAIQLAKLLGGRVIATTGRAAKRDHLLKLGADYAIDYSSQNVVSEVGKITGEMGIQVALDGGGKVTFPDCLGTIANNGCIVSFGYTTGMDAALPFAKLIGRNVTLHGIALWYNRDYPATLATFSNLILPAVAEGKLKPIIDQTVDLEGVSEALVRMAERRLKGKIVVVLS